MSNPVAPSITQNGRLEPFDLQVARGQVFGHTAVYRTAYSTHATSAATYCLWNRPAAYTFPTVASTMKLSSSAVGDTTQSVLIEGLDANYNPISEIIALNGQTGVSSTKAFLRVNDMTVLVDNPTGSIYFGTGTITAGVPANVYGFISALDNKSAVAVYTVPAGYTLYITAGSISVSGINATSYLSVEFHARINNVDYSTAHIYSSNGFQALPYIPPIAVMEKTDIYDTVTNNTAGPDRLTVTLSGILIKNNGAL